MADYLYSVAIQANSFHNDMADRTVWQINRGRIDEYSLYRNEYGLLHRLASLKLAVWLSMN